MCQVSVVIATYRRKDALKKALLSLGDQTMTDFEIVVVDDNAQKEWNEEASAIVSAFSSEHPDISVTYIANETNQGSAQTRNIGIAAAQGTYITFLDDDDVYLPNKLKNQVDFMESGGYDYSITDLDLYNENDKLSGRRVRASYLREGMTSEELLCVHLKYHLTGTDTMMFTKAYLEKIGGFAPINVGDEFYLMQRAIEGGGSFGYLPGSEIKAYVHTGEGGLSSGDGKIRGEKEIFKYKKTLFHKIDRRSRRYIRMRHYAVLAFAYLRTKKYLQFFGNGLCSFFCSPFNCIQLLFGKKRF